MRPRPRPAPRRVASPVPLGVARRLVVPGLLAALAVALTLVVPLPVGPSTAPPARAADAAYSWETEGGTLLAGSWSGGTLQARAADSDDARTPLYAADPADLAYTSLEAVDWSPDRRRVLALDHAAPGDQDAMAVDVVTGERRPVRVPDRFVDEMVWAGSQHAAVLVRTGAGSELWEVAVDSGGARLVHSFVGGTGGLTSSPDGSRLGVLRSYSRGADATPRWGFEVVAVDRATGATTVLAELDEAPQDLAWSPTGERLLLSTQDELLVVDLDSAGGPAAEPRPVPGPPGSLVWAPSGERVLVRTYGGRRVVEVDTGRSEPGPLLTGSYEVVDWQPDPRCTITGTDGDDDLAGTPGDDVICAGAGDDRVRASAGRDLVLAGPGQDRLDHADDPAPVRAHLDRWLVRGHGDTEVYGVEELRGTDFDDLVLGSRGDEVLVGGGGDDEIDGSLGDDELRGGPGRDVATFAHRDLESRGSWRRVAADLRTGLARGDSGHDRLSGIEDLTAWDGGTLVGDDGPNRLSTHFGGILAPRGGDDVLAGGGRVDYAGAPRGVVVDQAAGVVTGWGRDRLVGFGDHGAPRGFTGSSHDDVFHLVRGGAKGRGGDDLITVSQEAAYALGGKGYDRVDLSAMSEGVQVAVHDPPDRFPGGVEVTGVEEVTLTAHDDVSLGGPRVVRAGAGDDVITTTPATEKILAGPGDDVVGRSRGDDVVRGGGGDDLLGFSAFTRLVHGGAGQDALVATGSRARVRVDLGTGRARVLDRWVRKRVVRLRAVEGAVGTTHDDLLVGDGGPNLLVPGPGRDEVRGRGGRDQLWGVDESRDLLHGGAGRDECLADTRDRLVSCERESVEGGDLARDWRRRWEALRAPGRTRG
ncbi:Ca2+-binding RTX toxin-like protein [Nocardioides salarius]|uniref:Ca2+-binding RTX toxin-like protein n=1 Tax=Nocardioides salarius TaxID=374513 RepID=A0ABS2MFM1_9ACTN|nr:hypothetical protein [Nocardioides salarius]MBM7509912.1 Ca2+-binding RTX toxin-like protein [Nocardioides salarius]